MNDENTHIPTHSNWSFLQMYYLYHKAKINKQFLIIFFLKSWRSENHTPPLLLA